ncbi:MAG: hypothetical protein HGA75_08705 [Thiobacillus sp.]|nr:hypothetical protein [Thiobacillus sp.]
MEANVNATGGRSRTRLRREILAALVVKTALLAGLWWLFFAQAPSKDTVARGIGVHLAAGAEPSSHQEQQP